MSLKDGLISRRDVYGPKRMHIFRIRPYAPESTGSRPISEVKLVTAQSVLWWGTTREYCVLYSFNFFSMMFDVTALPRATVFPRQTDQQLL